MVGLLTTTWADPEVGKQFLPCSRAGSPASAGPGHVETFKVSASPAGPLSRGCHGAPSAVGSSTWQAGREESRNYKWSVHPPTRGPTSPGRVAPPCVSPISCLMSTMVPPEQSGWNLEGSEAYVQAVVQQGNWATEFTMRGRQWSTNLSSH